MALRVIGAGLGRTGTLSLKTALEELGFARCYHMTEVLVHPEHVAVWDAAGAGSPSIGRRCSRAIRRPSIGPVVTFLRSSCGAIPRRR